MFKIFEVSNNGRKEVFKVDEIYTVYEFAKYQLEYVSDTLINKSIFIEDEPIKNELFIESNLSSIVTKPFCFFEDYFGFAKISIGKNSYQLNILIEKLKVSEVEDIILYLFENNHHILDKFISKSSYKGDSIYNGKEYVYSSKYLNLIDKFCFAFEQLFINFKNIPHTIIRKQFKLSNYSNQVIDFKSIEWVLQNLDSVFFDSSLANHPNRINISNNYGLIDKIGAEENQISFCTYENEIILGTFHYLKNTISKIFNILNQKLNEISPKNEQPSDSIYSDFRHFKKIPFIRLKTNLTRLKKRVDSISHKYHTLFREAKPQNSYPKLTPVFSKYKHYQKAFSLIRLLRNSEYNLEGEIQLLNIRKLSELYELYNLSVMIEEIQRMFGSNDLYEKTVGASSTNDFFISKISYKKKFSNYTFSLYYEPLIKKEPSETDLITIGTSYININASYCNPDYVVEVINDGVKKYCILDAKYSKIKTVEQTYKPICVKKYLLDVGVKGNAYQKADFLVLLHPDSTDQEQCSVYNNSYFPKILTMISKPKYSDKLRKLLRDFE